MYYSAVSPVSFCATKNCIKVRKPANRAALKDVKSNLLVLNGPEEKEKAKAWVTLYSAGNSAIAAMTAQAPGLDELALGTVEAVMAAHILNDIYNFDMSKSAIKAIGTAVAGCVIGTKTFKWLTKTFTWVPLLGNVVNAGVSAATTAALGARLIYVAEEWDKSRKRGEQMDDFIKKLKKLLDDEFGK